MSLECDFLKWPRDGNDIILHGISVISLPLYYMAYQLFPYRYITWHISYSLIIMLHGISVILLPLCYIVYNLSYFVGYHLQKYGIEDPFHREALLVCIDKLCERQQVSE